MSSIEIPIRVHNALQEEVVRSISKSLQSITAIESFKIQYGIDTMVVTVYARQEDLDSIIVEIHEAIALCNPLSIQKEADHYDNGDNDQPTTCPKCGARTDFRQINTKYQMHTCLGCEHKFVLSHS